jgi:branched-chain amino acid aminotransferase
LYTPQTGKILPGITRDFVMTQAEALGYKIIEKEIFPTDLKDFDGAFFTGTAAEVTPISEIVLEDETKVEFDTKKGKDIKDKFFNIINGEDSESQKYFDYI